MFKIITTLTMTLVGLLAQAQVSENRNVAPFTKIKVTNGIEVIYTQDANPSVRIESPNESPSYINIDSKNGMLIISGSYPNSNSKVFVTGGMLSEIKAEEGAEITIQDVLMSDKLVVNLASNATFSGKIISDNVYLTAKTGATYNVKVDAVKLAGNFQSGSRVNLSGRAGVANLKTMSHALCHARNFITESVSIDAREKSTVLISAKNNISVEMDETASVTYFGNPGRVSLPDDARTKYRTPVEKLLTEN